MALNWYVARARPLTEYAARDNLESLGFRVFLPCSETPSPRSGHDDAPLFPGYLFLRYDMAALYSGLLRQVPQIIGLVAFDGAVPSVPDEVIDELERRVQAINGGGGLWSRYSPGDRVRVTMGPMESLAEVVEETRSPRARVRVLLEFLGRRVEAMVAPESVERAGASELAQGPITRPPRRTRGGQRWIFGYGPGAGQGQGRPTLAPNNGLSSS